MKYVCHRHQRINGNKVRVKPLSIEPNFYEDFEIAKAEKGKHITLQVAGKQEDREVEIVGTTCADFSSNRTTRVRTNIARRRIIFLLLLCHQ